MSGPSEEDDKNFAPWQAIDPSRRRFRRWTVDLRADLRIVGRELVCIVRDLSPGGACVACDDSEMPAVGTEVVLSMEPYGSISSEVRYAEGGMLGIRFIQEPADEARLARFLASLAPPRLPQRHAVQTEARVTAGAVERTGTVVDLSDTGARVSLEDSRPLAPGDPVVLHVEGHGDLKATVRRLAEGEIGVEFDTDSDADAGPESGLGRLRSWLFGRKT
ncbi:MAG: PilZ domain-containing protein [Alphaproteobacteria bacterium]|nr:PilZ domain-containing protein [Alphaproteobacteria bacterium]